MKIAMSANSLRTSAQQWVWSWRRKIGALPPHQLRLGAALIAIVVCRLLPASYWQVLDRFTGRPGDALLVLAVLLLVIVPVLRTRQAPAVERKSLPPASFNTMLEQHLTLDQHIDQKLGEVIEDTENSALVIIDDVRRLYDSASKLVAYLDSSNLKASSLGKEISDSVLFLVDIGSFIEQLPAKMTRDLHNVQTITAEIKAMSGLVEAVHAIGMQSHILAINASIEASRAGPSGAAFRVIADEMRSLASNSSAVATQINQGLSRARLVVEDGLAASIADSSHQLEAVSKAAISIHKLQDNFEDMNQYYKTRFVVVTKYNEDLALQIAEVLGQIQYQDVVRQCIDRIRSVIEQRNLFLQDAANLIAQDGADLTHLPALLEVILQDYLTEEGKHRHSSRDIAEGHRELKIELF